MSALGFHTERVVIWNFSVLGPVLHGLLAHEVY